MESMSCESCGMPMHSAADHAPGRPQSTWCAFCSTPAGDLQPFEIRLEHMLQWGMCRDKVERAVAEEAARDYMRQMPAWRNHPALQEPSTSR